MMFNSRRKALACAAWICLGNFFQLANAQAPRLGAEDTPLGGAHGSAATAPSSGGAIMSGRDPGPGIVPSGRDGRAFAYAPDRSEKTKVSNSDAQILRGLAAANLAEIKMAGLATAISGDEAIRLYGEKMLEEHYLALERLRQLANTLGVTLPGGVDTEKAALLRKQALLTGQEFDTAYLKEAGLMMHEQARKAAQAAASASSPEIRQYAAQLLPAIEEHRKLAETMAAEPAQAAAAVRSTLRAGQSIFLSQGQPAPGWDRPGKTGTTPMPAQRVDRGGTR